MIEATGAIGAIAGAAVRRVAEARVTRQARNSLTSVALRAGPGVDSAPLKKLSCPDFLSGQSSRKSDLESFL